MSRDGLSARLCTICLNTVVDDNSRGKAELVCGHLFHLDCIGSEFNYRNEMKCPNCRVVENGEWLIPDQEDLDDIVDDDFSNSMNMINRRLELHVYSHGRRDNSPTSRGQQEARLPMVSPTVHYHQSTIVLPTNYGGSAAAYGSEPLISADSLLRAYGGPPPPLSDSAPRTRVEQVVLEDRMAHTRPNMGWIRSHHHSYDPYHHIYNSPTNMAGNLPNEVSNDPSLELTLTTNPSDQEQSQQGSHDEGHSAHGRDAGFWFQVLD